LCRIKLEHLRLNRLPHLESILRMIDSFLRADVADMDHPFDTLRYCTKAPNLVKLTIGPSTTDPAGNFCAASAQGSPRVCFQPSEMRFSPTLIPRITASTVSPGFTKSLGLRTFLTQDISET